MLRLVLSMSLISALALAACSKKEEPAAEPEAKPATGEVKTEEAKPAENTAIANPSGSVGVAECDDYIAKMTACVDKLPEAQKASTLQSFEASKKAWTEQAANPEAKAQLSTACKTALDTAKQSLSSLGCTF